VNIVDAVARKVLSILRKLLVFKYERSEAAFGLNVSEESYSHLSLNIQSRVQLSKMSPRYGGNDVCIFESLSPRKLPIFSSSLHRAENFIRGHRVHVIASGRTLDVLP